MRFDEALPHSIDMVIPSFEKSYPKGVFRTLCLAERDSAEWYFRFREHLLGAVGRHYLPICRLADGEYQFAVGYRYPLRWGNQSRLRHVLQVTRMAASRVRHGRIGSIDARSRTYRSGSYTRNEIRSLRRQWIVQLKQIAAEGVLALLFSYRETQFAQRYFVPVKKWLDRNGIQLDDENYYPFYFVYALLNGPDRHLLYRGNRVLVVTHANTEKQSRIEAALGAEGARSVHFMPLSRERSFYDVLDLNRAATPVDLVLVGAGLGAASILCQLRPLDLLAIDAGYCIECLAYPERKQERTFCWPDAERQGDYRSI